MSQENVEVVKRAVAAINRRDIDGYLACCTEDVQLITPVAEVAGAYDGPEGIRRFFNDIGDAAPNFKIVIQSLDAVGPDRVLGFMRVTGTGRASGIPIENATGNVYDFADGRIQRRPFPGHRKFFFLLRARRVNRSVLGPSVSRVQPSPDQPPVNVLVDRLL
jgi:ketosteroid isomerase-like protein